jgi:hypothetical protein
MTKGKRIEITCFYGDPAAKDGAPGNADTFFRVQNVTITQLLGS